MCDLNCDNLIDLSVDDESSCNSESKTEFHAQLSENAPQFVPPSWGNSDNLENNPFDSVQKLADRLNDPFNIAENEACLKAFEAKEPVKIELGNLLLLSEDNLLNDRQTKTNNYLNVDISNLKSQELSLESPPVAFDGKNASNGASETDTTPNSSAESSVLAKLKNLKYRKRLLKLSVCNSTFSSPVSSIFSKAAEFGENLISSESPLKLIEDEDKSVDLEKKFEADLEMLKIPILNELPSPAIDHTLIKPDEPEAGNIKSPVVKNTLPNLETIKSKLKSKKSQIDFNIQHEISSLIENLKLLIANGEMLTEKKNQAADLLELLTSALIPSNIEEPIKSPEKLAVPPQTITRQGTFDLDIEEKRETDADDRQLLQEIPGCMISSSATYDGESLADKQGLNLPEIASLSPRISSSSNNDQYNMQCDINDIVEQLSKLLINNSSDDQTNTNNPTFIVVMNTNQLNSTSIDECKHNVANTKAKSGFVANYLENSANDKGPDYSKINSLHRRRSQSLSIHDKIKVVHLPLQPSTPHLMQKQQHSIQMNPLSNGKEVPDLKTPARMRRNSFASGTPYTPQAGSRRAVIGIDTKKFPQMRRSQTLDTHHEGQQHTIARPLSNNLTAFKPDLKKKVKPKIESILKSSGPLKATIPVKKVAPMLKTSPFSPERNLRSKIIVTPTTPIPTTIPKLSIDVGYPNACSTPAAFTSPLKRTTGPINKPRYSLISTTPKSRSSLVNSTTSSLKRRTISELKTKSPLKHRISNSPLQIPSSSRVSTGSSRLSVSAGNKNSKATMKAVTNSAAAKPTSRLTSRLSIGGSLLSNRNKENKHL